MLKKWIKSLWGRIKAEESVLGKLILKKLAPLGLLLAGAGQLATSAEVQLVQQYLDPIVFKILAYSSLLAAGIAKLTKKEENVQPKN